MSDGVWKRIRAEIEHWQRADWEFADVGAHWDSTEDYDSINEETYSYFRRFIDGVRLCAGDFGPHVVDFCCRTGNGAAYFAEHGLFRSGVCVDVSRAMLDVAGSRLAEENITGVEFLHVDDYRFPLPGGAFDSALSFESLEHFPHPERIVRELTRLVRPGGTLLFTTPSFIWEPVHAFAAVTRLHHSEGPHRFLRLAQLRQMFEAAGLDVLAADTTVVVPAGPRWLTDAGQKIERRSHLLRHVCGLRRLFFCRKREAQWNPSGLSGEESQCPAS